MSKELGYATSSISYSCISLTDVAKNLRLDSNIVSKAIQDGSKETKDIYFTNEPQFTFNSRICTRGLLYYWFNVSYHLEHEDCTA
ncbi:putative 26s proteasome non-atpase regulatory subunit 3 [Quercus suber]|uniref:26s proteasome non-atpase regulatory subunit 3 n=1 Tax=Quercus suber TaxID=58331 RepID=A0AAW0JUR7_QUESU